MSELAELSEEIQEVIAIIFKQEFKYLLMLKRELAE